MTTMCDAPELIKLGVTWGTSVTDFWKVLGSKAAPDGRFDAICDKIATTLIDEYLIFDVKSMMHMCDAQIQRILVAAGAKVTWQGMIEHVTNMKFASVHPDSAKLYTNSSSSSVETEEEFRIHTARFDRSNIGARMRESGNLQHEQLPSYVFDAAHECEDPATLPITTNDIKAIMNAYTKYMLVKYKEPAGDVVMRRHHAQQLKQRFPHLPDRGKTLGVTRSWFAILSERKRNIRSSKAGVCAHCTTRSRCGAVMLTCAPLLLRSCTKASPSILLMSMKECKHYLIVAWVWLCVRMQPVSISPTQVMMRQMCRTVEKKNTILPMFNNSALHWSLSETFKHIYKRQH